MIAAARIGERELLAMADDTGWSLLAAFDQQWLDYSEQRIAAAIASLPAARATGLSVHDPLPGTPPEGIAIRSTVTVTPEAGTIEVDLRDNLSCGLNMTEATAGAAEVAEYYQPLVVNQRRVQPDSEGAGWSDGETARLRQDSSAS